MFLLLHIPRTTTFADVKTDDGKVFQHTARRTFVTEFCLMTKDENRRYKALSIQSFNRLRGYLKGFLLTV